MPLGSFEGFVVTLLLLVPGGLGIELRRWIYPSKDPSAFGELLHALAAGGLALVILETVVAPAVGTITSWSGGAGDALLVPAIAGRGIPTNATSWQFYLLGYLPLALGLPALAGRLRRIGSLRRFFGHLALFANGPDQLFGEIWAAQADEEAAWIIVETTDDRSLRGQVVWRTTAPYETELLLIDVQDVTNPRSPVSGGGAIVWVPRENIRRLWLLSMQSEAQAAAS